MIHAARRLEFYDKWMRDVIATDYTGLREREAKAFLAQFDASIARDLEIPE